MSERCPATGASDFVCGVPCVDGLDVCPEHAAAEITALRSQLTAATARAEAAEAKLADVETLDRLGTEGDYAEIPTPILTGDHGWAIHIRYEQYFDGFVSPTEARAAAAKWVRALGKAGGDT